MHCIFDSVASELVVVNELLWRGSLLPLGCEAAPNPDTAV